jgi:hypothetical protein
MRIKKIKRQVINPLNKILLILKRLEKKKTYTNSKNELLGELKNLCVKIPLLQAIKDVPIYNKFIKEVYIKKLEERRKTPLQSML